MSKKLYAVFPLATKQQRAVGDHCFGDCGRISMGGALMTDYGPAMICCHDDCQHRDEDSADPIGASSLTGDDVYFRVLKPAVMVTANAELRGRPLADGPA